MVHISYLTGLPPMQVTVEVVSIRGHVLHEHSYSGKSKVLCLQFLIKNILKLKPNVNRPLISLIGGLTKLTVN